MAESEFWREVVRIKRLWPNLNPGDHKRSWSNLNLKESHFETFDIFDAKEIGLNGRGQIGIPKERYFENLDIFDLKEIGLNGRG